MKKKILFLFFLISLSSFSQSVEPSKILIIYFSRTGNTEKFVNYINEISENISKFKIEPASPYPDDYNTVLNIAQEEQKSNARPEIKNALNNVNDYDIILLGYPIWYSHLPNIVINQLEKLDLNGKTISLLILMEVLELEVVLMILKVMQKMLLLRMDFQLI